MLTYADVCLSPYLAPSDPSPHVIASGDSAAEEEQEEVVEEEQDGKEIHDDFRRKEKGGQNGNTDETNAGTLPKNSSEELLGAQFTRLPSTSAQTLPLKSAVSTTTSLDARFTRFTSTNVRTLTQKKRC